MAFCVQLVFCAMLLTGEVNGSYLSCNFKVWRVTPKNSCILCKSSGGGGSMYYIYLLGFGEHIRLRYFLAISDTILH